jgi:hypothetical protein
MRYYVQDVRFQALNRVVRPLEFWCLWRGPRSRDQSEQPQRRVQVYIKTGSWLLWGFYQVSRLGLFCWKRSLSDEISATVRPSYLA